MRALVLLTASLLTSVAACGPTTAPVRDEASLASNATLPVYPLRITMPGQEGVLEVKGDGSILADGQIKARFVGNTVKDEHGQVIVEVKEDGGVVITPPSGAASSHVVEKAAHFDTAGDIVIDDGGTIHVAEDGSLSYRIGKGDVKKAPLRVEGYKPEARREVAILFVLLTVPAKIDAPPPDAPPPPPAAGQPSGSPMAPPPPAPPSLNNKSP